MEFKTGKPPAGETGMCVIQVCGRIYFSYFDLGRFGWRDNAINAFELREEPAGSQGQEGWRWATLAEITAAGIPESEARGMVHRSQLPDAKWGPWIEWSGGPCPIPPGTKAGEWQALYRDGDAVVDDDLFGYRWYHVGDAGDFVAYRVKLSAVPAPPGIVAATCAPADGAWRDWHEGDTVPSVDRVDVIRTEAGAKGSTLKQIDNVVTTSQYWGPSSFVRKWRPAVVKPAVADPNSKMFDRDSSAIFKTEALEALKAAGGCMAWPGPDGKLVEHRFPQPQPLDHAAIVAVGRDYAKRQHDKRVAAAAWVERPRDHRLGNF